LGTIKPYQGAVKLIAPFSFARHIGTSLIENTAQDVKEQAGRAQITASPRGFCIIALQFH
jgi:hypothetical protein